MVSCLNIHSKLASELASINQKRTNQRNSIVFISNEHQKFWYLTNEFPTGYFLMKLSVFIICGNVVETLTALTYTGCKNTGDSAVYILRNGTQIPQLPVLTANLETSWSPDFD